jgi:large subunit ribosomal protein L3
MISGFIVKKLKMTSLFTDEGHRLAATVCSCAPLTVTQIKDENKDGYQAVQFAYGSRHRQKNAVLAKLKHLKLKLIPKGFVEFKPSSDKIPEIASSVSIDSVFAVGDKITVTGISKGHGFSGVIKRHGFHRQPGRGESDRGRAPGSIGAQTPGRVLRGKKMPGHYGVSQKTIKNLKVLAIDTDQNTISLSGAIPGHTNSWLILSTQKQK